MFALRDIEPGEEICFSYSGEVDEDGDEDEGSGGIGGKDEAIYVPCLCGAKKCTGKYCFFLLNENKAYGFTPGVMFK